MTREIYRAHAWKDRDISKKIGIFVSGRVFKSHVFPQVSKACYCCFKQTGTGERCANFPVSL